MIENKAKASPKVAYFLGIAGVVLTIVMAFAIIYFGAFIRDTVSQYGYLGAFLVSIVGGATIIIPVPMLAIVFALGGVMRLPWLVGIAAGLGEVVGALIIYMTGYGGGRLASYHGSGRIQKIYNSLLLMMEKRGSLTLFILSAVVNPFFYPAALAAGAIRFGVRKYFLICFVGKTIKAMTVVYAGYFGVMGLLKLLGISF